jgi:hypothetical protein
MGNLIKSRYRRHIKPQWVGWTGEARMAYRIDATDPFRDGSSIVEISVNKPVMENKWRFHIPPVSELIRRLFYVRLDELLKERENALMKHMRTYIRFSFSIGANKNGVNFSAIWADTSPNDCGKRIAALLGDASWLEVRSPRQDSITTIKDYGWKVPRK